MDADHRHELRENDLAEFIRHFGQFWSKWGNSLLIGVLVGALVLFGWRYLTRHAQQKLDRALTELHLETSPDGLLRLAESTDIVSVKAMAYLRGGEALLNRAVLPDPPDTKDPRSQQQREQDLDMAESLLQRVVDLPQANAVFALNAQLDLAAVAESRQQWDRATQLYESVQTSASADYPPIAMRAATRMAMLDRLQQAVRFAPDPLPVDAASAPSTDASPQGDTPTRSELPPETASTEGS